MCFPTRIRSTFRCFVVCVTASVCQQEKKLNPASPVHSRCRSHCISMTCNASPQCNPDDPPPTPHCRAWPVHFIRAVGKRHMEPRNAYWNSVCRRMRPSWHGLRSTMIHYINHYNKLLGATIKAWLAHLAAWSTSRDHVLPPLSAALVQQGRATDQQHRHHDRWQGIQLHAQSLISTT